jgi:hypothetical protein
LALFLIVAINNYVTKYGGGENIYIITQYYVVSWLKKQRYPDFASDMSSLRAGAKYSISGGYLYINGRKYPLPGSDWNRRSEPYYKAVDVFGI